MDSLYSLGKRETSPLSRFSLTAVSEAYIYASVEDHAGSDKGGCLQSVLPGYFANKLVSTGGSFLCKANRFDPEGLHSMTQHITS